MNAVANIFKNFGVERCALLAHMAAYPKEDYDQDPLEDEIMIMTALNKAGFLMHNSEYACFCSNHIPLNPPLGWVIGMLIVVCATWLLMTWLHVAQSKA